MADETIPTETDDTEGHKVRSHNVEPADDTEGHKVRSHNVEPADDTEGHRRLR